MIKTQIIQIIELFKKNDYFCLIGHKDPDGDCTASQLALAGFLQRKEKKVKLYSPGPFSRPELSQFARLFEDRISENILKEKPVAVVLDCSTLERIGDIALDIQSLYTVVIDHHASGETFGNLRLIDPKAPSVTYLIQKIIESYNGSLKKEEAELILFGLCTDTGFFRHLDENSADVFLTVSRLILAGASPAVAYTMINGNRSIESRILLGKLLSRAESFFDNKIIITYETLEDEKYFGTENKDSNTLYQQLQSTKGCEAVAFIKEENANECSVGLRSNYNMDVGSIARSFNGGGHKNASGFTWKGTRKEIKTKLIDIFSNCK